jgi:hypothetical protein
MKHKVGHDDLETRIKDQFPALFITLVSVLIGLALAESRFRSARADGLLAD